MAALTALQRLMASPKTAKFVETLSHADLPVNWADDPEIVGMAGDAYKELGTGSPFWKATFGNSKVVDDAGNPLTLHHGTGEKLDAFDIERSRPNMDIQGAYFAADPQEARGYGDNVYDVYLNLSNPADDRTSFKALDRSQNNAGVKARKDLINAGYDGVNRDGEEFIAFHPTQIKSVHNRGTFNPADPNIYKGLLPLMAAGGAAALMPGEAEAAEATTAETAPQFGGMLGYAARGNPVQADLVAAAQNQDWGEPVTWDDVRHGLSFGSRAVLEGLGGLAEMGPNAIANAAISPFTDYRFGNPGVAAADAMNLDRPQTDAERSMYGLESGAAEAVPFVAGGGALAKGSAGAAKQFGKFLADNPRAQAILGGMLGMMMGGGE